MEKQCKKFYIPRLFRKKREITEKSAGRGWAKDEVNGDYWGRYEGMWNG